MAGSDTFRISSEQTVMPSWLVASIKVACSIAHRVVWAARLPASARGSIWDRRAEMTANSAPTKNALTRPAARPARSARERTRSSADLLPSVGPRLRRCSRRAALCRGGVDLGTRR